MYLLDFHFKQELTIDVACVAGDLPSARRKPGEKRSPTETESLTAVERQIYI